jgi:hypothetical protein
VFLNVPTFTRKFSLQDRKDWFNNLKVVLDGSPNRYFNDERKILASIMQMNNSCRQDWLRYLDDLPTDEEREEAGSTWSIFEEWTMTLITHTHQRKADVKTELEELHHRSNQHPRSFARELGILEDQFPRRDEEERALDYLKKLSKSLRESISLHGRELPKTREEMIDLAVHFWDHEQTQEREKSAQNKPKKRKTYDSDEEERPQRFKRRGRPYSSHSNSSKNDTSGKPHQNPLGTDGKRTTCNICKSENHWAPNCPDKKSRNGSKAHKATAVQNLKATANDSEKDDELE